MQLAQPAPVVRLGLRVLLVEPALPDRQDLVDLLAPMVVTEVTVLPDPLVVKAPQDLLVRPDLQDLLVLLDRKVRLVVLHSSTILAQQQQIATPVQVR